MASGDRIRRASGSRKFMVLLTAPEQCQASRASSWPGATELMSAGIRIWRAEALLVAVWLVDQLELRRFALSQLNRPQY